MALSLVLNKTSSRPMTSVEIMQMEINHIQVFLQRKDFRNTTPALESIHKINELVDEVDNANDFYKIGGFDILPNLLSFPGGEVKAATLELIANIVQNNVFCQSKVLKTSLAADILRLLRTDRDPAVCIKALYALSCFCRNNHQATLHLQELGALPILFDSIGSRIEKIQTKAAFLLSDLVFNEPFVRNKLFEAGLVEKIVELTQLERSTSQEHLLKILLTLAETHKPSRYTIRGLKHFKSFLMESLVFYEEGEEYQESKEYTMKLLSICFND